METVGDVPVLFLLVFQFVRLVFSGHQAVAIENAALRMQIAASSTHVVAMHLIRKGADSLAAQRPDVVGQRQFIHTLFGVAA